MSGLLSVKSTATTISQLQADLKGVDSGKYLREGPSGTSIHTSSKVGGAFMNFFADHGLKVAKERQDIRRENGSSALSRMIDNEFGAGIAKLVFMQMRTNTTDYENPQGRDFSKGVTVGDLAQIKELATRFSYQGQYEPEQQNPEVDNRETENLKFIVGGDGQKYPLIEEKEKKIETTDNKFIYKPDGEETGDVPEIKLPEMTIQHEEAFISLKYNTKENDKALELADKQLDLTTRVVKRQMERAELENANIKMDPVTEHIGSLVDEILQTPKVNIPTLGNPPVETEKKTSDEISIDDLLDEHIKNKGKTEKKSDFEIEYEEDIKLFDEFFNDKVEKQDKNNKEMAKNIDDILNEVEDVKNLKPVKKGEYFDLIDFDDPTNK